MFDSLNASDWHTEQVRKFSNFVRYDYVRRMVDNVDENIEYDHRTKRTSELIDDDDQEDHILDEHLLMTMVELMAEEWRQPEWKKAVVDRDDFDEVIYTHTHEKEKEIQSRFSH